MDFIYIFTIPEKMKVLCTCRKCLVALKLEGGLEEGHPQFYHEVDFSLLSVHSIDGVKLPKVFKNFKPSDILTLLIIILSHKGDIQITLTLFFTIKENICYSYGGMCHWFRRIFFFYRKSLFTLGEGTIEGNRKVIFARCWIYCLFT